jgi:CheY-like chemotaxis protein
MSIESQSDIGHVALELDDGDQRGLPAAQYPRSPTVNDVAHAFKVLLVEDDPADVLMTREALDGNGNHTLSVVPDGTEAMAYLRRQGPYGQAPMPNLILLDLNLPKRSGREVLADLKDDPHLRVIPVVVLTTSTSEDDIIASYRLHANAYVIKPVDFDQFTQTVRRIGDFFLSAARIPPLVFYGPAEGVPRTTATAAPARAGTPKRTNAPEAYSIHARLGSADRGQG